MRYQNWDVLIFPLIGDSKTPLQEFGTACTVVQDPGESGPMPLYLCTTLLTQNNNNRCRSLPNPFCSFSLLHRCEGPVADGLMLHTEHLDWVSVSSVVA